MGVAEYIVSGALPAQLRSELPTAEEFAREFPYMSVVKLRIEIEKAIRPLLASRGIGSERATGWVILQAVSSPESLHPRPEYDQ